MRKTRLLRASRPRIALGSLLLVITFGVIWVSSHVFAQRGGPGTDVDTGGGRWELDTDLPDDSFTFVRLIHQGAKWHTDFPDSDRNLTARLQQLTAWEVNPTFIQLEITDPRLFDYPFAFMTNVDRITFDDKETRALRNYLNSGGFIMIDDFWGDKMWRDLYRAMKEIYPSQEPVELKLSHPIFSCVFQLDKLPQVPSHDAADRGYTYEDTILSRGYGETVESLNQPHYQAWHDEKGRMVMLACHNNDLADGWEEEDHSPEFFKNFSEPYSFPMGINIIFYAMTH